MTEATSTEPASYRERQASPLAVVGLACRFPDADDPGELLDAVLTGRRAFRRLPAARLNLADYYQPDLVPDATYSTRAALIEGWRFDCAAFGIDAARFTATDPAHWLALETTARALAAAGLPDGRGLNRDRTGVIFGNSLAGEVSRANALRARWPYVRQAVTEALGDGTVSPALAGTVLQRAENRFLAPFPPPGEITLDGSMPGSIAAGIASHFGFRGGSHVVDSAGSSSLQAIASGCAALSAGDLDVVIAGGVDISLDPFELIGLAQAGVLATADVRVYDVNPTGYLPGEGCGVLVLMRTADAVAADLPVYAEIIGWGTSGGAVRGDTDSLASSHLLAMRRAYERAGTDPASVHLIEGNGSGTRSDDDAELTALARLRAGARQPAVLGSVKANIGHAKAAAGAAGLIKTVLALGNGVLPPTTGAHEPHALISAGDAHLQMPQAASGWPDGVRLAAVSTMAPAGSQVHVVLRHEPGSRSRRGKRPAPAQRGSAAGPTAGRYRLTAAATPLPFLLHGQDRFALAAVAARLADIAAELSDAELQDLACALARDPGQQGRARVAIMAVRQEQLAALASQAVTLLPHLEQGKLTVRPGIFASDLADGRVTLLLSDDASAGPAGDLTAAVSNCLDTLRWLESLEVQPAGAVGHGVGALAGLAWAAVLGEADVADIAALRAGYLRAAGRSDAPTPPDSQADQAAFRAAIARKFRFGPPRRRLLSTMTGAQVASVDEAIDLICTGFPTGGRLLEAVAAGAAGSTLLLETGPGKSLVLAAAGVTSVPAVSLGDGYGDPASRARAACALFAAGALGRPQGLFDGLPCRPIDIWRRQVFITNPCQVGHGQIAASLPRQARRQGAPGAADRGISDLRQTFEHRVAKPAQAQPPRVPAQPAVDTDHDGNGSATPSSPPPAARSGAARRAAPPLAGHQPWVACFTEKLRPSGLEPGPQGEAGWRIHAAFRSPLLRHVGEAFGENTDAARTLAVLASPADADSRATAVRAARDAITTGRLVAVTTSPEFTGFFASLHAEHPSMGITVLRVPGGTDAIVTDALHAAARFARTQPGAFTELVISSDGTASEPVMSALAAGRGGTIPLDPDDVVLISRGTRGAGLVLAQVMACCGNPVALIGRAPGDDDGNLIVGLEELRSAGARVSYEVIDIADPPSLAAAVERITGRLGPVRAVAHAATPVGHVPLNELSDVQVSDYLAAEIAVLDQLVGAVRPGQLKLIITVGSVAGRYGLAGGCLYALGGGALASRAASLAGQAQGTTAGPAGTPGLALPGCRALHVDVPPWTAARLGDPPRLAADLAAAGTQPVDPSAAARLLLKALATADVPGRVALHGRAAGPALRTDLPLAAADLAAAGLPDGARFLREVVVYYPGAELVCEATLSVKTDPYLADYRIDGIPVLPEVLAIEALAQAASVLAGRPVRLARQVRFALPVVIPMTGAATLRVCAVREGDAVTAVLRSADSSFQTDHVRATFSVSEPGTAEQAEPGSSAQQAEPGSAQPGTTLGQQAEPGTTAQPGTTLGQQAEPGATAQPGSTAEPGATLGQLASTSTAGLVDGTELYGPICFQSGRFRRLALLPEVTVSACRALARGADDKPWFNPQDGAPAMRFLLGSPGVSDATLQVIQVCVPHQRIRLASCDSVMFSGRAAEGAVEIRATALPLAAAPAQQLWQVRAVDSTGRILVAWHNMRFTDVGPLPRNAAWPPQLLSVFLHRRVTELGLGDALEIAVSCGQPDKQQPRVPRQADPAGAGTSPAGNRDLSSAAAADHDPLAGFGLAVTAGNAITCAWTAVEPDRRPPQPPAGLALVYAQLRNQLTEPPSMLVARLQAVGSCLARARQPGGDQLRLTRTTSDGWALLEMPGACIGCVVVDISGVPAPVAIALLAARPAGPAKKTAEPSLSAARNAEVVGSL